ncbi:phage terminase large subunit GpA-like protein [Comamonas sp. BIGb0124]|uniref:terminase gpA endonuclease subunit n=1 Tax=Comamonas sp. BIGb0124 TaxID=2485130 RepID=UPI000F4A3DD1|nr:terminase gpA endonuclease subunit [Comamonas sp. BIGb0124]ROR25150.1 phage terminase large subunit GpA-like protein [Comamonas sp. BIGb0124]
MSVPHVPAASSHAHWARMALRGMFRRTWSKLKPPPRLNCAQWAAKNRWLSEEESAIPGKFKWAVSPALEDIAIACSRPGVRKVVVQKSAQVGYTAGIVCNVIGYNVHYRPSVIVALFPRTQSAKDFSTEKLEPTIRATAVLASRIELRSRALGNSTLRKKFPGGLLKLVGSNSPADVKSTSARIGIAEEPDDVSNDVRGQGNSLRLLQERLKTYGDSLFLLGGTPTAKGASAIEAEMQTTDKQYFYAPCHGCGEAHIVGWQHVTIPQDTEQPPREVYNHHWWERAYYTCPHCGETWSDDQRIANIRRAKAAGFGWLATAKSENPGFYLNELLSTFDGSRVPVLAEKYLVAKDKMDKGDPSDMIAFRNSTEGLPWEYKGELPEEDELRNRAEPYAEWSCPARALEPVMMVDVQHDRVAVTVWVFGRGEEMWLAHWGEYYGKTVVAHQGAWLELEALLDRRVRNSLGVGLRMRAIAIDSGDGQTSEAVYSFVRKHHKVERPVYAVKGASDDVGKVEIWQPPKAIDPNGRSTKASRMGIVVHMVGTAKAKDLILGWSEDAGRVRLSGDGPGHMHWYEGVRDDFFEQLLGEIKIPSRTNTRLRVWKERRDRNHEALDCTVYAVWCYRQLRLHLRKPAQWDLADFRMRQSPLMEVDGDLIALPDPASHELETSPVERTTPTTPSPFETLPLTPAAPAAPPAPNLRRPPAPAPAPARSGRSFASREWSFRR